MFVDASALAAIILDEPDGAHLSAAIDAAGDNDRMTSPIAVFETVLAVNRAQSGGHDRAMRVVLDLLRRAGIAIPPIDDRTGITAILTHARYGKGTGHPASLNLGDCFAYAMAKQHRVPLLYKGDDFARTDLA